MRVWCFQVLDVFTGRMFSLLQPEVVEGYCPGRRQQLGTHDSEPTCRRKRRGGYTGHRQPTFSGKGISTRVQSPHDFRIGHRRGAGDGRSGYEQPGAVLQEMRFVNWSFAIRGRMEDLRVRQLLLPVVS